MGGGGERVLGRRRGDRGGACLCISRAKSFVIPDGCPAQAGRKSGTYPLLKLVQGVGPGSTPGSLTRLGIRPG